MAKFECTVEADFDQLLSQIERGILRGSVSVSLEDASDFYGETARCSVRVFERYSATGSNRVSLSVTLFQDLDNLVHLSAITSGGSQALFFKVNIFGENAFLSQLKRIVRPYQVKFQ